MSYVSLGDVYDRRGPSDPSQYPTCVTQAQHDAAHAACKPSMLRGLGLLALPDTLPCWVDTLPICPPPRLREPPRRPVVPPPRLREPPRRPVVPTPVDWVAVAKYAAAVKAANDKRAADLLAYVQAVRDAKAKADLLAYFAAVKAAHDKQVSDLLAYAAAVKARAALPPAARLREPPVRHPPPTPLPAKPPILTNPPPSEPPPPVQETPPAVPASVPLEVATTTEEDQPMPVMQAGFGTGGLLAVVAVVAVGGWLIFGRKKKAA